MNLILVSKNFSKEQKKYIFNEEIFDLGFLSNARIYDYKICNKHIYYINNTNKLIQNNLDNTDRKEISLNLNNTENIEKVHLSNLIDLNENYILLFFTKEICFFNKKK